jgi:hypothetical protein
MICEPGGVDRDVVMKKETLFANRKGISLTELTTIHQNMKIIGIASQSLL